MRYKIYIRFRKVEVFIPIPTVYIHKTMTEFGITWIGFRFYVTTKSY